MLAHVRFPNGAVALTRHGHHIIISKLVHCGALHIVHGVCVGMAYSAVRKRSTSVCVLLRERENTQMRYHRVCIVAVYHVLRTVRLVVVVAHGASSC